ncbi:MAG: Gfo/Idh/MocA family oxidoreductase [Chloroflexota bacterium]|nr:Gfo/Idh/MocA family oxidoreductase [Chloroflexota bacterium]
MTRVAVVGAGAMGKHHARIYNELPECELVAVVDENEARAQDVARLHGSRPYRDIETMLERERPDAVSVATPTQSHVTVALAMLEAGCHVLVEKPIAATLEDARELVRTAERSGRVLMVGHVERYNPAIIELKRRLDAGELGRIFQIGARRLGPFPPRIRDVGVVVDLATHDLDIMRYLTGSEAVRVYAETKREVHTSNEDLFAGMVRFANGTLGVMEINWLTPTKVRELSVTGERGMFRADYLTQDLHFFENAELNGGAWTAMSVLGGVSEGSMTRYAFVKREPLRVELEAFLAAVRGDCSRQVHGRDGVMALALALALIESAESAQVKLIDQREAVGTT